VGIFTDLWRRSDRQCDGRSHGVEQRAPVRTTHIRPPPELLNSQDSAFKDALNNAPKYVASRTPSDPLPWPNSTLLRGEIGDAVAALRDEPGNELHVIGSGELIQTLIRHNLIEARPGRPAAPSAAACSG
jgi:RibD C-terminal domain